MVEASLFSELVGQSLAIRFLAAALDQGRLAPAYLLAGPEGVGRKLAALRFLEGVLSGGVSHPVLRRRLAEGNVPDMLWLEPTHLHQGQAVPASQAEALGVSRRSPPQIRLEQVREVAGFLARRPLESPRSMVVIETAEAMAEPAANALLKTLEEPGDGLLILISAAPQKLLVTIRSRCQLIPFHPLSRGQMGQVLNGVTAFSGGAPHGAGFRRTVRHGCRVSGRFPGPLQGMAAFARGAGGPATGAALQPFGGTGAGPGDHGRLGGRSAALAHQLVAEQSLGLPQR